MKKKGFTLVELLAAIVILGLITAIAVFGISKYTEYAKESKLKYIIKNLKQSAEIKYNLEDSKSKYELKELLDEKDLKSPYGGQLEGFVYNICDENNSCKFGYCITPNTVINLDDGSIACSSENLNKESAENNFESEKSLNYNKRYNSTILRLSNDKESDKEDLLYTSDYYVDDGDKIIKVTDNNKKLLIHQEVEYHYDDKNPEKYLDCIVLANDGNKATLLAIGSNDDEMNSRLSGDYMNYVNKNYNALNYYKTKITNDNLRFLDIGDIKAMSYFDNDIKLDAESNLSSSSFSNGQKNLLLDDKSSLDWLSYDYNNIWIQYEQNTDFSKSKYYFQLHYTSSKKYTGFELIKKQGLSGGKLGLVIETQNYHNIKQLSTTIE